MKLTSALYKYHPLFIGKLPKFRGSAMSGKNKYVPAATRGDRYRLWNDWKDEEEVCKYISKPYITTEEELVYLESIGQQFQDVDPLYTGQVVEPLQQRYAVDLLRIFERNRQYEIQE